MLTTKVKTEQEVIQINHENEETSSTSCTEVKKKKVDKGEVSSTIIPIVEAITPVDIKREQIEFEGTDNAASVESTSGIPGKLFNYWYIDNKFDDI